MSNLVYSAEKRNQQSYGKFKPQADQKNWTTAWAAVEGDSDGRYPSVGEIQSVGIPVGSQGRGYLKFEEFKGPGGKTHDIKVGGLTLREMKCPKEDADQKTKLEGLESTEMCRNFLDKENLKNRYDASGLVNLSGDLKIQEQVTTTN